MPKPKCYVCGKEVKRRFPSDYNGPVTCSDKCLADRVRLYWIGRGCLAKVEGTTLTEVRKGKEIIYRFGEHL